MTKPPLMSIQVFNMADNDYVGDRYEDVLSWEVSDGGDLLIEVYIERTGGSITAGTYARGCWKKVRAEEQDDGEAQSE